MKTFLLLISTLLINSAFGQKDSLKIDSTKQVSVLPSDPNSSIQLFPFLNVVPPSPEAASLGKYGETPVSLANGTSSTEIPIYEIVSGNFNIPIKLSNHSAGVKVNDIASSVGLGWSLNAGGVITRVVKGGLWDDCSLGMLNQVIPEESDPNNFYCFIGNLTTNIDYVDAMPDDFFYNFNGMSGKFLFNNRTVSNQNINPIPISYPNSNLKIEWINQINFKITDQEGNIYKFEDQEQTNLTQTLSARDNPCGTIYTSAWYLTEMISANRIDTITFKYTPAVQVELNPIWSTTLNKKVNNFGNITYTYQYAFQRTSPRAILLNEITHKNGKVTFTYANDRQDMADANAKRLTTISIFNKEPLGNYSEIKHFNLKHSYFLCSDGYSQIDNPQYSVFFHTDSTLLKKLRLDEVFEVSPDNQTIPPFKFTYYEETALPIYASLAQDYWGYANGAVNNKNLLLWNTDPTLSQEPSALYGANCNFNFTNAIAGTLKQIIYPTKGYSTVFYEPQMLNDGTKGGGIRIKKIINSDSDNTQLSQKSFNYIQSYFTNSSFLGDVTSEAYVFTTQVMTDFGGVGNCNQWALLPHTTYPEKINFSLGSAATFVAYNEVEEYYEDSLNQRLGKVNYNYSISSDIISPNFPLDLISTEWKRGLLINKKIFSKLGNGSEVIISEEQNNYQEYLSNFKARGYVARMSQNYDTQQIACPTNNPIYCNKYSSDNQYVFQEINQNSSILLPTKTIKLNFDYNGQNPVKDTVLYEFNNLHFQLTQKTQKNSDGKINQIINKYPHDFISDPVYSEMVNRHIFSPIIETEQLENGISLKKAKTNYKLWYPSTSFGGVNGFFAPYSVETSENNSPLETEIVMGEKLINPTQNGYDLRARPILFTTRKDIPTTFEWWDIAGKKDFLKKKSFLDYNQTFDYSKGQLISSIDQSGFANYYNYDSFNRLFTIKDREFNLIQSLIYHYGSTPTDKSYVKQSIYRTATTEILDGDNSQKAEITFSYIDGLGSQIEKVGYKQSPLEKDIVSNLQKKDLYGRIIRNLLPTPTNVSTGNYQNFNNILNLAKSFYADNEPLDSIIYENSILMKPLSQFGPGEAWRTADKKTQIFNESAGSDIRYYAVNNANSVILNGFYPANSLFKKRIIDEQGNTKIEITDKRGRLVQSQIQKDNAGNWLTTYYCYDGLGRRRAVLQPEAFKLNQSINATDQAHDSFVFAYEYDSRGRLIRQDIPGAGEVYSVYDKADRLVMQKNALQSETGNWNFWQYDAFGREVMRGETGAIGNTQSYWQNLFNQQTQINEAWDYNAHYYNGVSFPSATAIDYPNVKQYQIYDDYDFAASEHAFKSDSAYHQRYTNAKGLLTLTVKRDLALIDQGQFRYYIDTYYYDNKNRPIQAFSTHDMGGANNNTKYKLKNIEYNFAGEVVNSREWVQSNALPDVTIKGQSTYNHVGLLTNFYHAINGTPVEVFRYTFDPINRPIQKKVMPNGNYLAGGVKDYIFRNTIPLSPLSEEAKKAICLLPGTYIGDSNIPYSATINPNASGGTNISGLQTIDYSHHIRGLLKGINLDLSGNAIPNTAHGDLFAYKLEYETAGFYDGNIGSQKWHDGQNQRNYSYTYDPSKRLKTATFTGVGSENYSLPNINYDDNGNILNLVRNGKNGSSFGAIDDLSYFYTGNRLNGLTDAVNGNENVDDFRDNSSSNDYTYYSNGSLKSDANKGISLIEYNTYLNKVKQVIWSDGRWLKFYYDGSGSLIKKENSAGEYWHYVGDMIYKNGGFYSINIPDGRAVFSNNNWNYEFDYRDVWGNLRVSFAAENGALILKQKSDYDALGYIFNQTSGVNKNYFQYQKQQRIEDFDLNIDFFKFRPSDPTIGRFWQIDPLSSQFSHNSPYALQENKFGMGVELEGKELYGFGRYVGGVVSGIVEDISLGAFRAGSGSPEYNAGVSAGHKASVVIGTTEASIGGAAITGSTVLALPSGGTTVISGAAGALMTSHGSAMTLKAMSSVNSEGKNEPTGSYTNTHESGKTYHGKGGEKRAAESGKQQAAKNNDPLKSTDWKPAKNDREAFKDESRRMQKDEGGHNSSKNYNKRDSPGTKYRKQDGEN